MDLATCRTMYAPDLSTCREHKDRSITFPFLRLR